MPLRTIQADVTAIAPLSSSRQGFEIPENVRQFVRAQALGEYVDKAIEVARAVFIGTDHIVVSMKRDEYGDDYVDINAVVSDDPALEAEKYSACAERWSSLIPAHAGGKIQLSTSWAKR
jgi:hypothetical protein